MDPIVDLIRLMRLFTRTVDAGSFSAAAREAGTTQPTVSRQIANLETELGVRLLARGTTGLKLTEAGEAFCERARQILREIDELRAGIDGTGRNVVGRLRVNSPAAFGEQYLTPILVGLAQRNPALVVDLVLSDHFIDLVEGGIDVAIRFGPLPDLRLVARKVGASPQACFVSPAYAERYGEPQTLDDLERHQCIVNSFVWSTNVWRFLAADGERAVEVRGSFRANNLRSIRAAVLADAGIAIGPVWLYFDDLRAGRVRRVLRQFEPRPLDIHALHLPGPVPSPKVQRFLEALEGAFRDTPVLAETFLGKAPEPPKRARRPAPVTPTRRKRASRTT